MGYGHYVRVTWNTKNSAPPDGGKTSVMAQVKVTHDVTACIYQINCDKPVSKWSFQTKLEEQQRDKLVERLKMFTKVILVATFVNFPLDIYHICPILNDS